MNGFDTTVVVLLLAILAIQLYETFGKKESYSPFLPLSSKHNAPFAKWMNDETQVQQLLEQALEEKARRDWGIPERTRKRSSK